MKYRHNSNVSLIKLIYLTFLVVIFYKFAFYSTSSSSSSEIQILKSNSILDILKQTNKNGIFVYNLSDEPDSWWNFECVKTQMKHTLNTHLCIHDSRYDKVISGQLKEHGLWEPNNVRSFIKQMQETPDAHLIDIGSNIGLYALIAAKHNRSVLAVEPLYENVIRMHKAAHMEHVQKRIKCLINAISNERKQLSLMLMDDNYGGSFVIDNLTHANHTQFLLTHSSVIVNSILLDDLVDVISDQMSLSSYRFILKIDIEGYEPLAFDKSEIFFKRLQIVAIYIEIGKIQEKLKDFNYDLSSENLKDYYTKVLQMLNLFQKLDYEPYETNGYNKLDYLKWRHWPWDVYLRKCDLTHCTDHKYKLSGSV